MPEDSSGEKRKKKGPPSPPKAAWRPVGGIFEIVAPKSLLVRSDASLTAPEVCRIPPRTRVMVTQTVEIESGITRARITQEGQQDPTGNVNRRRK